jgi:hypothetical protein
MTELFTSPEELEAFEKIAEIATEPIRNALARIAEAIDNNTEAIQTHTAIMSKVNDR